MRRFAAQLRCTHRETTLTPGTWPYDVPVYGGIGVGDFACPGTWPEAVPPRTTAAPDVRVRASVVFGKVESRPPRRLGLPSRGAELDSSASPRLRGDLGLRGCTPSPDRGGRTWEQAVGVLRISAGVQWHSIVCREILVFVSLWCWGVIMGWCVWCGGSVAEVSRGCFGEAGVYRSCCCRVYTAWGYPG